MLHIHDAGFHPRVKVQTAGGSKFNRRRHSDALRARTEAGNALTRLVFASSSGVFGADAGKPMPKLVTDDTLPAPQTSYGTHKSMCEYLVADYSRKLFTGTITNQTCSRARSVDT